ncbi:hypothetical protein GLOIN_2v1646322 [Rhizophagus irregularis DAOM 181602=DAOM 197198]|nr:hypothetical protein GLOIN_2v1646322 [Rhizophagus irregularis DAOM 181602=DAOM 197198]POG67575.1 hypothetical protein GLOIN_2v1646322 [Rhizophagus irregularis DAOM 181602=DAOM 197198]|eukprot:XP_025174441.1 hypothetical protein GLOIN_2v1646322 [Rhizophagus irregularis DAOM 181602=DAOM 197198]
MYEETTEETTEITLNCIAKERGSEGIFSIDIGKDELVSALKHRIEGMYTNTYADYDPFDILIWRVDDVDISDEKITELQENLSPNAVERVLGDNVERLSSWDRIGKKFSNQFSTGVIHVIAQGWCVACDKGYNSLKSHQESDVHKDNAHLHVSYNSGDITPFEEEEFVDDNGDEDEEDEELSNDMNL